MDTDHSAFGVGVGWGGGVNGERQGASVMFSSVRYVFTKANGTCLARFQPCLGLWRVPLPLLGFPFRMACFTIARWKQITRLVSQTENERRILPQRHQTWVLSRLDLDEFRWDFELQVDARTGLRLLGIKMLGEGCVYFVREEGMRFVLWAISLWAALCPLLKSTCWSLNPHPPECGYFEDGAFTEGIKVNWGSTVGLTQ